MFLCDFQNEINLLRALLGLPRPEKRKNLLTKTNELIFFLYSGEIEAISIIIVVGFHFLWFYDIFSSTERCNKLGLECLKWIRVIFVFLCWATEYRNQRGPKWNFTYHSSYKMSPKHGSSLSSHQTVAINKSQAKRAHFRCFQMSSADIMFACVPYESLHRIEEWGTEIEKFSSHRCDFCWCLKRSFTKISLKMCHMLGATPTDRRMPSERRSSPSSLIKWCKIMLSKDVLGSENKKLLLQSPLNR